MFCVNTNDESIKYSECLSCFLWFLEKESEHFLKYDKNQVDIQFIHVDLTIWISSQWNIKLKLDSEGFCHD